MKTTRITIMEKNKPDRRASYHPALINAFTLIELVAAMGVFAILMCILLTFFDTAQRAWMESMHMNTIYGNSRIMFDLIERDIQSSFYEKEKTPFWHKGETNSDWGAYRNELLAFVGVTSLAHNINDSKLCEMKYQLYYSTSHNDSNDGWIMRSATCKLNDDGSDNAKWNYYQNFSVGRTGSANAFTANEDSSDAYTKIIPYVAGLSFTCYEVSGTEITPDTDNVSSSVTAFPYSVRVQITLMDGDSFKKWQILDAAGAPNASTFKNERARTFSKTFLIGERGQYD